MEYPLNFRNISVLLLLSFFSFVIQAGERIEAIQWYTNTGSLDAFEIKVIDEGEKLLYYSAHSDVIDSSIPGLPDLSTYYPDQTEYTYKLEESGDTVLIFSVENIPRYKTVSTVSENGHKRTLHYDYDSNYLKTLYVTEITEDDEMIRTWYEPDTMNRTTSIVYQETFADCIFYYQYDSDGRIIHEIIFSEEIIIRNRRIIFIGKETL